MPFNKEQLKAIESEEKEIVIIAPPGSGKTATMVGAVERFIKKDNPWTVVITFTNKAADELKAKLAFNKEIEISTIHSWSYRELIRLSEQYGFRVRLLEEQQIYEIIRPFLREYQVSQNSISYVYNHVMGNINPDLYSQTKAKYDAIRQKYIAYKRKMHLYDFTDLPLYLKIKLEDCDEYIHLDGLFVDEFQDVDPDQLAVFNRVVAAKKFFIGDVDQAIYIFRGATEEIFREIPEYKVYRLNTNYRSYQEILNFAYDVKRQKVDRITEVTFTNTSNHGVLAARGNGGIIIQESSNLTMGSWGIGYIGTKFQDGTEIQADIESLALDELKNYDYRFLCRTNREVKELQRLGVPYASTIHQAKGLEFDNVAVIDFEIKDDEDLNVAFVALTRAKNRMMVIRINDYLKKAAAKMAF